MCTDNEYYCHDQGIDKLLQEHPDLMGAAVLTEDILCKKNTGNPKRLRKWSRGHQFIVRGGGHIDTWQPLYQSVNIAHLHLNC